jgi:hypothetical protein
VLGGFSPVYCYLCLLDIQKRKKNLPFCKTRRVRHNLVSTSWRSNKDRAGEKVGSPSSMIPRRAAVFLLYNLLTHWCYKTYFCLLLLLAFLRLFSSRPLFGIVCVSLVGLKKRISTLPAVLELVLFSPAVAVSISLTRGEEASTHSTFLQLNAPAALKKLYFILL